MKTERLIAYYTALLQRAFIEDRDKVKQYAHGLHLAQAERIKELERELAKRDLTARYKKVA